jgi:hypothetical protein
MTGGGRRRAAFVIFVGSHLALAIGRVLGLNIDRAGPYPYVARDNDASDLHVSMQLRERGAAARIDVHDLVRISRGFYVDAFAPGTLIPG